MSIGPKGQRLNFVNDLNDLWENDQKMETCWDSQSLTCACANMHFEIAKEENVLWEKIVSRPVKVLGYGFDYTSSFRTPKQSFAHQLVVTTLQRDENDFSHSTTRLPPSLATGLNVKVTNATAGFTMDRTHTLTTFIALIHLGTSSSHSSSREQMLFVL